MDQFLYQLAEIAFEPEQEDPFAGDESWLEQECTGCGSKYRHCECLPF
jgi:hypothetical protein